MVAIFSRLRQRISFTALFLAFLSFATILATPASLGRSSQAIWSSAGPQKADSSSELTAAVASLQSGQGPLGTGPISCSSRGPGSAFCGSAQSGESALASNTPSWTNITSPDFSRNGGAVSYDAADRYVVLFGGVDAANNFLGDTWKFSSGVWTNITTSSGPSARALSAMVYDSADGYLVLFGGGSGMINVFPTVPLHDTWKFSAGSWENITSSSAPSPRFDAAMAYDVADAYAILFGGLNTADSASTQFLHDTWRFSGGSWTNVTLSSSPSPPFLASMAYDAGDGYVVLFGPTFSTGSSTPSTDNTWRFSAGVWTNITTSSGPSARGGSPMTYDAADGYMVLFGGQAPGLNNFLVDTWKFSAGVWTNITTSSGPSRRAGSVMTYDGADGYVVLFGGLVPGVTGFTFLQDSWRFLGGSWTNIAAVPSPKGAASMAYDAKDGYVVLFGGGTAYGLSSETWKFSAGVWSNITMSSGPPPRAFAAMTYDTSDGYIVLFGGQGFGVLLSDTWKFSAGVWTNITSASGPSRRVVSAMTYDTGDSYTVLFGGCELADSSNGSCLSFLGDTWKFQAGVWTNITSVGGPSRRLAMSLAYDAADSYVLLFGGAGVGNVLSDTWKFQGGVWTNITTVGGPSRRAAGASLAYDAADGYSVLFGGDNFSGLLSNSLLGDSWKFSAGSWTNITSSIGPSARFGGSMAFDTADGYVVLFGGQDRAGNFIGQTWKFSASLSTPSLWTNITTGNSPSPRGGASMAYDAADGYVVLFGGLSGSAAGPSFLGDTWKFSAGIWTNITTSSGPSSRSFASMTYDSADGYLVLFGGGSGAFNVFPSYALRDTWKFLGGSWTNITASSGPSTRFGASMAYDATDGYVILFGGGLGDVGSHDTWKFSAGVWTNITTSSGPSPRTLASMAYDATDGYEILFGGLNGAAVSGGGFFLSDTWKFLGGSWTNVTSGDSPSRRELASMAYDGADGYVVLFGGGGASTFSSGFFLDSDTWKFLGGSWTNITAISGPSPRFGASTAYDAADGYVILFGGIGTANNFLADTWKFLSSGAPSGFDYSLSNNGPVSITGGSSGTVTISATLKAGTAGPVTLSCVSVSLPAGITCGSFTVNPVTPTGTSDLTINVASTVAPGSYTFQVNGSPASATASGATTTVTVTITSLSKSRVYVVNAYSNTTSVIDDSTNTVVATVKVGIFPTGVAFDSSNDNVYVANEKSNTVSVINGTTNIVIATVNVGSQPVGIAFDSSNNEIYVTNYGSSTVSIINGETNTLVATVTVGGGPTGIVFDSTNNKVYVTNYFSDSVSVIDGNTNAVVASVDVGHIPVGIAFDSSNNDIYVTNQFSNTVSVISGTRNSVVANVTVGSNPYGVAFDSSNNEIYVANGGSGTVSIINGNTNIVLATLNVGFGPIDPAFDSSNNAVYVPNRYSNTTSVIDGNTNTVAATINVGGLPDAAATTNSTGTAVSFDYSLSNSGPVNIGAGSSGAVTVTATLTSGTSQPVTLSCPGLPTGVTCGSFTVNPVTPTISGATSVLTINVATSVAPGSYSFQVTASPLGATTTPTTISVTITSLSSTVTHVNCTLSPIAVGGNTGCDVKVVDTSNNPTNPTGTVTVTTSGSATITGSPCTLSPVPNYLGVSVCQTGASVTISGTQPRTDTITATYSGDTGHSISSGTFVLQIGPDPTTTNVSCSPNPVSTGSVGTCTVTVTDTATGPGQGPPRGTVSVTSSGTGTITGSPCTLSYTGSGLVSTCSVTYTPTGTSATTDTITGSYSGDSSHSASTNMVQVAVTVPSNPFSYTLSVSPAIASIFVGGSTSATVTAILTSGTAQPVTLYLSSVSPLPTVCLGSSQPCGPTAFTPLTITPSSTGAASTMTISTTNIVPPGTYTLTIAGSPTGLSSGSATFTLTITAPSISNVGCGHDISCSVQSNATLSKIHFAGITLHVEADGPSGAHGYANITVPRTAIPDISATHVFVDNNKLSSSKVTITSNSTAYFIYFTFTFHSPVLIDIQLTAPENAATPNILGVDPTIFYSMVAGIIGLIAIVGAAVALRRRKRPSS